MANKNETDIIVCEAIDSSAIYRMENLVPGNEYKIIRAEKRKYSYVCFTSQGDMFYSNEMLDKYLTKLKLPFTIVITNIRDSRDRKFKLVDFNIINGD